MYGTEKSAGIASLEVVVGINISSSVNSYPKSSGLVSIDTINAACNQW